MNIATRINEPPALVISFSEGALYAMAEKEARYRRFRAEVERALTVIAENADKEPQAATRARMMLAELRGGTL